VNAAVRDLVVGGSESRAAAGLPDLHVLQKMLQALLVVGALAVVLVPRRKSALQLAALTAVLLIGFEIVLTHWSLLYITWFYPFAALALLAMGSSLRAAPELGDTGARSLNDSSFFESRGPEPARVRLRDAG
jgi:CHASE2 domain-containing sensor protein